MNSFLLDSYLESMNFLNEISINYPDAISFASGRPNYKYFNVKSTVLGINDYAKKRMLPHQTEADSFNNLGQYNKTNGIINEQISKLLSNDENINVDAKNIVITSGAQEGMVILIDVFFKNEKDVLLVSDPSYVGFVGYAKIRGINIKAIPREGDSISLTMLEDSLKELTKHGKKVKLLYDVPNFHNPTGHYMSLENRKRLIELAEKYNFHIVEDDPYGYFSYGVKKIPTLKAIDNKKRVIYLGSFSKLVFPSLRIGYLIVDQNIKIDNNSYNLVNECKKVKSFVTVNTSTLLQAMLGSILESQNYSLVSYCNEKISSCKKNRDILIEHLERSLGNKIALNKPKGGFFLSLDLPFEISTDDVIEAASKYDVIFTPMNMFYIDKALGRNQVRLAFSNLTPEIINLGAERFCNYIEHRLRK